jgi:hypothetical protein
MTAIPVSSAAGGSGKSGLWFWVCKGAIVSVLSETTAYGLWVYYGRPDFYIRGFSGEVPLTILLGLFLWVPLFLGLYGARRALRIRARTRPVLRFLGFVVLTTVAVTAFHLCAFRIYFSGFHAYLPESGVYVYLGIYAGLVVGATLLSELLGKPIEKADAVIPPGVEVDRK